MIEVFVGLFKTKSYSTRLNAKCHRIINTLPADLIISSAGYVYIWLSNEGEVPVQVYFDDFRVEHVKSPLVSSQDYYPFGLSYGSCQREDALSNQYQYNGKEMQDELSIGWLDYGARMYDPSIARWMTIDLLAGNYLDQSPYNYVGGNPVKRIDPDGMRWVLPEDKEERKMVKAHIRELRRSSETARDIIRTIRKSDHDVKVKVVGGEARTMFIAKGSGGSKPGEGAGGTIFFNPNQKLSADHQEGNIESTSIRKFAEEMVHAGRSVEGKTERSDSKANLGEFSSQFGNANEEIEANHVVNIIMSEMGKGELRRTKYSMTVSKTDSEGAISDYKTVDIPLANSPGSIYQGYDYNQHAPRKKPRR